MRRARAALRTLDHPLAALERELTAIERVSALATLDAAELAFLDVAPFARLADEPPPTGALEPASGSPRPSKLPRWPAPRSRTGRGTSEAGPAAGTAQAGGDADGGRVLGADAKPTFRLGPRSPAAERPSPSAAGHAEAPKPPAGSDGAAAPLAALEHAALEATAGVSAAGRADVPSEGRWSATPLAELADAALKMRSSRKPEAGDPARAEQDVARERTATPSDGSEPPAQLHPAAPSGTGAAPASRPREDRDAPSGTTSHAAPSAASPPSASALAALAEAALTARRPAAPGAGATRDERFAPPRARPSGREAPAQPDEPDTTSLTGSMTPGIGGPALGGSTGEMPHAVADLLADLVNDALIEQARRHGVDLS